MTRMPPKRADHPDGGYNYMKETFNSVRLKSSLRKMSEEEFFETMMHVFATDISTSRMQASIEIMDERFGRYSKKAQLTWALDMAVRKGNTSMIDFLLGEGALIDGTKNAYVPGLLGPASFNPLVTAIMRGTEETLAHLLWMGANPNPPKNSFLYDAAYINNSAGKTRILLDAGARGGAEEALYNLIQVSQRLDIADLILDKAGLSVNIDNGSIVKSAVMSLYRRIPGAEETVRFLLSRGADFSAAARSFDDENNGSPDALKLAELAHALAGKKLKATKNTGPFPGGC